MEGPLDRASTRGNEERRCKRPRSGDLAASGPANTLAQQNLYLLFNDWRKGYSIRKLDLRALLAADVSAEGVTDATTIDHTVRSLPPAVFCFEASRDFPAHFAAAFDTKIITINPRIPDWHPSSLKSGRNIHPVAPMKITAYDVQSREIMLGPLPKTEPWKPIYIAVGHSRLFALYQRSFERLSLKPRDCWVRPWKKLQDAPFESEDVYSYAVHPDEKTLFVSVLGDASISTFTFDTANGGLGWEARAALWLRPPKIPKGTEEQGLPRRCCKEYLTGTEPAERLISLSLLYMRAGSHFCLALVIRSKSNAGEEHPSISALRFDEGDSAWSDENNPSPYRHVLRLTTFSLKYDENGDLTTGDSLRIQNYNVPEGATESALERPFAFVM
ncbi:hypothetical protein HU200_048088 [Digitaria exilis]|uniref:Uncharacterized protein n=1 Tax=Digitaria exilis TaxID=1010633 RepID=A0A835E9H1_9POAL|nr:hypothetical protein HU200_048088 [Digitaria exilis]